MALLPVKGLRRVFTKLVKDNGGRYGGTDMRVYSCFYSAHQRHRNLGLVGWMRKQVC